MCIIFVSNHKYTVRVLSANRRIDAEKLLIFDRFKIIKENISSTRNLSSDIINHKFIKICNSMPWNVLNMVIFQKNIFKKDKF